MAKIGNQGDGGGAQLKVLGEKEIEQVEKMAALLSVEQIADILSVGKTTFYEIMKRQPEVSERYKKGKAKAVAGVAKGLLRNALDGDNASIFFYLKTRGGYKETTVVDNKSSDGSMTPKSAVTISPDADPKDAANVYRDMMKNDS